MRQGFHRLLRDLFAILAMVAFMLVPVFTLALIVTLFQAEWRDALGFAGYVGSTTIIALGSAVVGCHYNDKLQPDPEPPTVPLTDLVISHAQVLQHLPSHLRHQFEPDPGPCPNPVQGIGPIHKWVDIASQTHTSFTGERSLIAWHWRCDQCRETTADAVRVETDRKLYKNAFQLREAQRYQAKLEAEAEALPDFSRQRQIAMSAARLDIDLQRLSDLGIIQTPSRLRIRRGGEWVDAATGMVISSPYQQIAGRRP